jgi:hypothetical protein
VTLDPKGQKHFVEKEVIDGQDGKQTVIESETIKNEKGEVIKSTTHVE